MRQQQQQQHRFDWKSQLMDPVQHNAHVLRYKSLEWDTSPVGQALQHIGIRRLQTVAVYMPGAKLDRLKARFSACLEKNQFAKALQIYHEIWDLVWCQCAKLIEVEAKRNRIEARRSIVYKKYIGFEVV